MFWFGMFLVLFLSGSLLSPVIRYHMPPLAHIIAIAILAGGLTIMAANLPDFDETFRPHLVKSGPT